MPVDANATQPVREGQVLTGPLFREPMRVETARAAGPETWVLGLVGLRTGQFTRATLSLADIQRLDIRDTTLDFAGDAALLRLGVQAHALGIAWEFDPYFALSISRVDPLPHQLEAVYDYLLKLARVRFLLADDAGAGKTIMTGLLLRELTLRGLVERVLIVCPSNLAFQWQRELGEKFGETFVIRRGEDIRDQFGVNLWLEQKRVITSLDLAKRQDILPGLRQAHWDLVVVDEAHRMSAADESHKSLRYQLGELLRDTSDHLLLLTATPHKGDPANFCLFLQLLDRDAFADVVSIRKAIDQRRAPFYLRRTKEAMYYFPERQPDGSWAAKPIFTKRIPHTVAFQIDGPEFALYRAVTDFVKEQSQHAAAAEGTDTRARAVGFLMALYQRRLASSTYAMRRSLEKRADRLDEGLKRARNLVATAPPDLPDADELDEMDDGEREKIEAILDAITLAGNADQVREEIAELHALAEQAKAVEAAGTEAKLARLRELLHSEGIFEQADQRLLVFTEFRDTLDYLLLRLREWGFRVGSIHGGMKPGSRDEPGTRLHAEQQFRDGVIQVLVATEAAGEGINLQACHILFNYDIPWNPNRLEQRMGRIHRYGQHKDCLIFNFVADNTVEGRVLQRLLEKLQEIRDALDDDAVFNVVGEVLPAAHVERVLRDYYAGKLGDADLEDRLLRNVDERGFRAICQNALEGLASKKLNLAMLVERRALAQERRVVPETIARFLREAAGYAGLEWREVRTLPHAFELGRTPSCLRRCEQEADWKLPALAARYPRCSTDRETAEKDHLEWVTPGHPLFEAARRHVATLAAEVFARGACFHSLEHAVPARIDLYRARVADGLGNTIHERLFAVELQEPEGNAGAPPPHPCRRTIGPPDLPPSSAANASASSAGTFAAEMAGPAARAPAASGDVSRRPWNEGSGESLTPRRGHGGGATDSHGVSLRFIDPAMLGNLTPASPPAALPVVATLPEASDWLHRGALLPFLAEARRERLAEVDRIAAHVELSLGELLQRADEEIGRAADEVQAHVQGAEGRLAQAETRHADLLARRDKRRAELERQRSLTLQAVERLTSVLVLPHPERDSPQVGRLRPSPATEQAAMRAVVEHETSRGCKVEDIHERDLGYDLTSLDLTTGELRLIEVKGLAATSGTILLTPNERRVAEDRRDCYWLYVVTGCATTPTLQPPIRDPARFPWHEVSKVQHYWLTIDAMSEPMEVREVEPPYAARQT